ncbi:MAG: MTH938/NDUFAF3 family protein [Pelistega sp.]|nr:MTH938/NDUFAF3 family protein [Pelistega sp.]
MLLQKEERGALNTVTAYSEDHIAINEITYPHPVYFRPEGEIHTWDVQDVQHITTALVEQAAGVTRQSSSAFDLLDDAPKIRYENAPEVLIIGTGKHQVFLDPAILAPLLQARIGIEVMDSKAASRTYNVLMSEGRKVAVALLI